MRTITVMATDHGHGGHHHAPASFGTAFAIGIGLNTAFVVVEALFGYAGNSVALIADAGHNLSDVLGLVVAWLAELLSKRAPSARFTYGLRGSSILAALFNAIFLLVAVGAIGWEALLRLFNPEPVASTTVIVVAAIGIIVNGVTAWLFASGRDSDLNIRGAYLHMASDALVSAGVVAAGLVIAATGWVWLDPLTSLVVSALIVAGTWGLLRDSVAMSLDAMPAGDRSGCRSAVPRNASGCHGDARPAHLVDEHKGNRADLSPGDPRRTPGRRLSARPHARSQTRLRDRAPHRADRD